MTKTAAKTRPARPRIRLESLEARALRTGVGPEAPGVVLDLGAVSASAASRGVEVSAPIEAGRSITFRFEAEAAGRYALRVRHDGEGLTLLATGPGGSSSIDPGPAGPFAALELPIERATYEIRAGAPDGPVFVDWELLLISGAAQAPAVAPTVVGPAAPLPIPGPPGPSSTPSPTAPPAPVAMTGPGPISPSVVASGGPVGRPEMTRPIAPVGPTTSDGSPALASLGDGPPPALIPARPAGAPPTGPSPASPGPVADVTTDEEALELAPWLDRLARLTLPAGPGDSPAADDLGLTPLPPGAEPPADRGQDAEQASFLPFVTVGLAIGLIGSRRLARGPERKSRDYASFWANGGCD